MMQARNDAKGYGLNSLTSSRGVGTISFQRLSAAVAQMLCVHVVAPILGEHGSLAVQRLRFLGAARANGTRHLHMFLSLMLFMFGAGVSSHGRFSRYEKKGAHVRQVAVE